MLLSVRALLMCCVRSCSIWTESAFRALGRLSVSSRRWLDGWRVERMCGSGGGDVSVDMVVVVGVVCRRVGV